MYGRLENANLMLTINALSLFSLTDFLDRTLEIKKKYTIGYLVWSVNILRFPSFQSVLTLPENLRRQSSENIKSWCDHNFGSKHITEFEKESLLRLIDYLDIVKTPHRNTSERPILLNDFKRFYQQYDLRRNKNFLTTFPKNVGDWFTSIEII